MIGYRRRFGLWLRERLEHLAFRVDVATAPGFRSADDLPKLDVTDEEWQAFGDAIAEQADSGRTVYIEEPPGGLTSEQRRLIEAGVNLLRVGDTAAAADAFWRAGVSPELFRVRNGRLVPEK